MKTQTNMIIPVNVKTRIEFFSGFGIKELINTVISASIGLIISLIIYQIFKNLFISLFIVFLFIMITVIFSIKDRNNQSVYLHIKNLLDFVIGQKEFEYEKRYDWYDWY